jgi:hypothetical protein
MTNKNLSNFVADWTSGDPEGVRLILARVLEFATPDQLNAVVAEIGRVAPEAVSAAVASFLKAEGDPE